MDWEFIAPMIASVTFIVTAGGVLVLRAIEPGSAEYIRAAVDYDGIHEQEDTLFNLTLQRVAPDTGLVLDQEIFRKLTCEPYRERSVDDVLVGSSLVRVQEPLPDGRPVSTDAEYIGPEPRTVTPIAER